MLCATTLQAGGRRLRLRQQARERQRSHPTSPAPTVRPPARGLRRTDWSQPQLQCPASSGTSGASSSRGGADSGSGDGGGGPHAPPGFELRQGRPADLASIWSFVLSEKINPLGIEPSRFTIATASTGTEASAGGGGGAGGGVAGVVQTVPLGEAGGGGVADGVRAVAAPPGAVELRTLVVAPEHRRCGLGSGLVRQRLSALPPGTPVWLTTVAAREPFYQRLGFRRRGLTEAPRQMYIEVAAGLLAARLLTNQQLVLMSTVA